MPKVKEVKKQVLVRLPEKIYECLLLLSTKETVKRGKLVSVPMLIAERIKCSLEEVRES